MQSFDLRLRRYEKDGTRGDVLPTLTIEVTGVFNGMHIVSATVTEAVQGSVPDFTLLALEFWDGTEWAEPDDGRFIASTDKKDSADTAGVKTLTCKQFIPWLLQRNRMPFSSTMKNGERPFSGSAGLIAANPIIEGQNRDWGPLLTYDFDSSKDSADEAWSATIKRSFPLGGSAWSMFQWLVSTGHADFTTTGNVIHLWKPGYGVDRTGSENPVRITQGASKAPISRSVDDILTAVTAQGDGMVWDRTEVESELGLGTLEGWVQDSGAKTKAAALAAAKAAIAGAQVTKREVSVTFSASEDGPLPYRDFNLGDTVEARYEGDWTALRVVEWVIRRKESGAIEVTVILGDRFKSTTGKILDRPTPGVGGAITPGGTAPTPVDEREPKAPSGVTVTATGEWSDTGEPVAKVVIDWTAVTDATTDEALTVDLYEVWVRLESETKPHRVTATSDTSVTLYGQPAGATFVVTVIARSAAGVWSEPSDEVLKALPNPTTALPAPDTPTVDAKDGNARVRWNGLLAGSAPAPQFVNVYVVMSTTETGTYSPVGQTLGRAGESTVTQLDRGGTYWFKLYAVDRLGVDSPASTAVSVTIGDLPAEPEDLAVTPSGYWTNGTPLGQIDAVWSEVTTGQHGVAVTVDRYELLGRRDDWASPITITRVEDEAASWSPFTPGETWHFSVRARSDEGEWGDACDEVTVVMVGPEADLDKPATPDVTSERGVLTVSWSGLFDTDPVTGPPAYFMQANVEISPDGTNAWVVTGVLFEGGDKVAVTDLGVGSTWFVRLVALDYLNRESDPSEVVEATVVGITGPDIEANSVDSNILKAGSVETQHLSAALSGQLTVTADNVEFIIGELGTVQSDLDEVASDLADQRLRYGFDDDGLRIRKPGAPVELAIDNESLEIRDAGTTTLRAESGRVTVGDVVLDRLIFPTHIVETTPAGVVWRSGGS